MAPPNDHGAISMLLALVGPHKGKRGEVDLYPKNRRTRHDAIGSKDEATPLGRL